MNLIKDEQLKDQHYKLWEAYFRSNGFDVEKDWFICPKSIEEELTSMMKWLPPRIKFSSFLPSQACYFAKDKAPGRPPSLADDPHLTQMTLTMWDMKKTILPPLPEGSIFIKEESIDDITTEALARSTTSDYGTAICTKDVALEVWGDDNRVNVVAGDKLTITYHEQTGDIGLTMDDVELFCSRENKKYFDLTWFSWI